ncbi:MAG TPA: hypothetical protein VFA53_12210 [Xanthobacteraceae bacterium]|nr:hypothetical protein [Xanthobacteraceae bacterium]
MNRAELIFPAALSAVVALLLFSGYFVLHYSFKVIAFPLLTGAALCALCLVDIVMTMRSFAAQPAAEQAQDSDRTFSLASLAWALSLLLFVYAFGFVFGPALYLLTYLRIHGSSWALSFGVAGASLAVTWGLFINLLRILLPIQPLWWPW